MASSRVLIRVPRRILQAVSNPFLADVVDIHPHEGEEEDPSHLAERSQSVLSYIFKPPQTLSAPSIHQISFVGMDKPSTAILRRSYVPRSISHLSTSGPRPVKGPPLCAIESRRGSTPSKSMGKYPKDVSLSGMSEPDMGTEEGSLGPLPALDYRDLVEIDIVPPGCDRPPPLPQAVRVSAFHIPTSRYMIGDTGLTLNTETLRNAEQVRMRALDYTYKGMTDDERSQAVGKLLATEVSAYLTNLTTTINTALRFRKKRRDDMRERGGSVSGRKIVTRVTVLDDVVQESIAKMKEVAVQDRRFPLLTRERITGIVKDAREQLRLGICVFRVLQKISSSTRSPLFFSLDRFVHSIDYCTPFLALVPVPSSAPAQTPSLHNTMRPRTTQSPTNSSSLITIAHNQPTRLVQGTPSDVRGLPLYKHGFMKLYLDALGPIATISKVQFSPEAVLRDVRETGRGFSRPHRTALFLMLLESRVREIDVAVAHVIRLAGDRLSVDYSAEYVEAHTAELKRAKEEIYERIAASGSVEERVRGMQGREGRSTMQRSATETNSLAVAATPAINTAPATAPATANSQPVAAGPPCFDLNSYEILQAVEKMMRERYTRLHKLISSALSTVLRNELLALLEGWRELAKCLDEAIAPVEKALSCPGDSEKKRGDKEAVDAKALATAKRVFEEFGEMDDVVEGPDKHPVLKDGLALLAPLTLHHPFPPSPVGALSTPTEWANLMADLFIEPLEFPLSLPRVRPKRHMCPEQLYIDMLNEKQIVTTIKDYRFGFTMTNFEKRMSKNTRIAESVGARVQRYVPRGDSTTTDTYNGNDTNADADNDPKDTTTLEGDASGVESRLGSRGNESGRETPNTPGTAQGDRSNTRKTTSHRSLHSPRRTKAPSSTSSPSTITTNTTGEEPQQAPESTQTTTVQVLGSPFISLPRPSVTFLSQALLLAEKLWSRLASFRIKATWGTKQDLWLTAFPFAAQRCSLFHPCPKTFATVENNITAVYQRARLRLELASTDWPFPFFPRFANDGEPSLPYTLEDILLFNGERLGDHGVLVDSLTRVRRVVGLGVRYIHGVFLGLLNTLRAADPFVQQCLVDQQDTRVLALGRVIAGTPELNTNRFMQLEATREQAFAVLRFVFALPQLAHLSFVPISFMAVKRDFRDYIEARTQQILAVQMDELYSLVRYARAHIKETLQQLTSNSGLRFGIFPWIQSWRDFLKNISDICEMLFFKRIDVASNDLITGGLLEAKVCMRKLEILIKKDK